MDRELDHRLTELPPAALHGLIATLSAIDEFKGWWRGRESANAALLRRLGSTVVHASAVASVSITGTGETPATARGRFIHGRLQAPGARAAAHVTGYAEALRAVFEHAVDLPFAEPRIRELHERLLRYSLADRSHRGQYRRHPHASALRGGQSLALRAADPDRTPGAMSALTQWTASRLAGRDFHPLLVIATFILEFLAIRPFADGNGRLSRLLTNLLLLQSGYSYVPYASLERIIAERWTAYYFALRQSQANRLRPRPDITPWLGAFVDVLRAQVEELRTPFGGEPDHRRLSRSQRAVLGLSERHRELSNRLVRAELGLPRETAKQILNRLLELNLLQRMGAGRGVTYRRGSSHADGWGTK